MKFAREVAQVQDRRLRFESCVPVGPGAFPYEGDLDVVSRRTGIMGTLLAVLVKPQCLGRGLGSSHRPPVTSKNWCCLPSNQTRMALSY